jgi:hypothetical protein
MPDSSVAMTKFAIALAERHQQVSNRTEPPLLCVYTAHATHNFAAINDPAQPIRPAHTEKSA